MPTETLKKIEEPAPNTRAVFMPASDVLPVIKGAPAITGQAPVSYACAGCGVVLIENIVRGSIINVVIRCPRCGTFNEV